MDRRLALLAVLGAHLAVALFHGGTHTLLPVVLAPWQNLPVLGTVFVGPVVGVALAWREHPLGIPVFTAAMAGALLLGVILHFLVENPDHVHAIPHGQWQLPFQASAVGVTVTEGLGIAVGAWYWRTQ